MAATFVLTGFTLLTCLTHQTLSESAELRVYNLLFNTSSSYQANVRPVENSSSPVAIDTEFDLLSIKAVDEVNQVMTVVGFVLASWTDEHLKWNPADYGGLTRLVVPANNVWRPDFVLVNSAGAFYDPDSHDEFRVRIHSSGKVTWDFGGTFAVNCDLDLTYYPFDMQVCALELENWVYDKTQVELKNASSVILQDNFQRHGIWHVFQTKTYQKDERYAALPGLVFPKIKFQFFMSRRHHYFTLNMAGPGILLALIAMAGCLLPADSGEKVGLGITNLLAFSVYQLIIAGATPTTSLYSPLLTLWMFILMVISAMDTLVAIGVLYMHHHLPTRPPHLLRVVFLQGLTTLLCMKHSVPAEGVAASDQVEVDQRPEKMTTHEEESIPSCAKAALPEGARAEDMCVRSDVRHLLQHLTLITDEIKTKAAVAAMTDEWMAIACVIDRLFFFLSFGMILIATGVCFSLRGTLAALEERARTN